MMKAAISNVEKDLSLSEQETTHSWILLRIKVSIESFSVVFAHHRGSMIFSGVDISFYSLRLNRSPISHNTGAWSDNWTER